MLAYVGQPGDTLSVIADAFGSSVEAITAANGIPNPDLIFPGMILGVPSTFEILVPSAAEKRRWPSMKNWLRNWSPCSRRQDRAWGAPRGWKRLRESRALRPRR